ncbi:MAG: hypothetical protein ABI878_13880 [Acidobacteriota bacterium]
MQKLELSQADVAAVIDYVFQHVRASPNGRGHKVWERMLEFQGETVSAPPAGDPSASSTVRPSRRWNDLSTKIGGTMATRVRGFGRSCGNFGRAGK